MLRVPRTTSRKVLRNVLIGDTGIRLITWVYGEDEVGFALYTPNSTKPLFTGTDGFYPDWEGDQFLSSILIELTNTPEGDDYDAASESVFETYTPEQAAWCRSDTAKGIRTFAIACAEEGEDAPFKDIEDPARWIPKGVA